MVSYEIISLRRHCAQLSTIISELWLHDPATTIKDGECFEYPDAAEWLDLAGSVRKVDILTGQYDESLLYDDLAMEYEDARSELFAAFTTQLTIFTFIWGAFETMIKIIDPLSIPKGQRLDGANSLTDRMIYYVRFSQTIYSYESVLDEFINLINQHEDYQELTNRRRIPTYMGKSGEGIDLVRRIRNKFAHGSATLPKPDVYKIKSYDDILDIKIIILSSRIVLLTIQMALKEYFKGNNFMVSIKNEDGTMEDADIHIVLEKLHLQSKDD